MTLVAGVDSRRSRARSSSATRTPVTLVREGAPRTRTAPRSTRDAWWAALDTAIAAAGGLDDVEAVAVGGQQHGMVCLDDDGRGRPPGAAVERHPLGPGGRRPDRRARRRRRVGRLGRRRRHRAGRLVHRHQAALARRPRAGRRSTRTAAVCLPHDWLTWRLRGATGLGVARHRPERRQRHRLLVAGDRRRTGSTCSSSRSATTSCCRGCSARGASPGVRPPVRCSGPGAGDNAGAALGLGARAGRRRRVDRHLGCRVRGVRRARPPTRRARSRASPTRPAATCRWSPPSTRPGCSTRPPRCSASTTTGCPSWRCRRPPGADGLVVVPYLEGERTPEPPRRDRRAARLAAGHVDAGPPGARRGRGDALRAGRRRSTRSVAPGRRSTGVLLIGGGARSEAVAGSPRQSSAVPVVVPDAGRVRRGRRGPAGRLGAVRRPRPAGLGGVRDGDVRGRSRARGARPLRRGPRPHRRRPR